MPYISPDRRDAIHRGSAPATAGELNYAITAMIVRYVMDTLDVDPYSTEPLPLTYDALNGVVGVLESAKAEFQRRIVAPFEDGKMALNGDVYGQLLDLLDG